MLLTYRYKLMPTRAQYRELDLILESQRLLYNAALQEQTEAWRKAKVSISKIDQSKSKRRKKGAGQAGEASAQHCQRQV